MAGRILLLTKLKGGAGCTTLARELAVAAAAAGLRVGIIDLDAQGGITGWWNRRYPPATQPNPPESEVPNPALLQLSIDSLPAKRDALRQQYDLVVIDSPPTVHEAIRRVAAIADLAIIPSRPTSDDLAAVGPIVRLIRGAVDFGFIITQVLAGRRGRDAAEAHELLARAAAVFGSLPLRADFPRAASNGRTGFETGGQAREEVSALWRVVADRLEIPESGHPTMPLSSDSVTAESR